MSPLCAVQRTLRPAWPALALVAMLLGGCAQPGAHLQIQAIELDAAMHPRMSTVVYRYDDKNTIDIFASDIPPADLADPEVPNADLSGTLVQIHIFLVPMAGRTPIDPTACNATVRDVVLASGAFGVYGGGGFVLPSSTPGDEVFSASVRDATLRLIRAGPGFKDALGPSRLEGTVDAALDPPMAEAIGRRLDALLATLPEASPPPAAP